MAPPPLQLSDQTPEKLPASLQRGIEAHMGVSMDGVHVVYGSHEPARYGAAAFARKGVIHLGLGQDHLLPHEATHIAQQRLGHVRSTGKREGQHINEEPELEKEAEHIGKLAAIQGPCDLNERKGQTLITGQDIDVTQFAPKDFVDHPVLKEPAKTSSESTTLWTSLCLATRTYSETNPLDMKLRLKLLREMTVFLDRWEVANNLTVPREDLDPQLQEKLMALSDLKIRLLYEYNSLGASNGNLVTDNPGIDHTSPEPELTIMNGKLEGPLRGYFLDGAQVINAKNQVIATPSKGDLCRVTKATSAPIGKSEDDYYMVSKPLEEDNLFGLSKSFPSGFVKKDHVNAVYLDKPANKTLAYEDRFDPVIHPLFQAPPSVNDVEQSALGDCYLLASILTLVRHNPNHIMQHMVDHGDGVISVKLYEKDGEGFKPIIVHVRKSVVIKKNAKTTLEEGYNKGAIWVQLLEKAYIAAGFAGCKVDTLATTKMQWSQAIGGEPFVALGHLTGRKATYTSARSTNRNQTIGPNSWADPRSEELDNHLREVCPVEFNRYAEVDFGNKNLALRLAKLVKSKDEVMFEDIKQMVHTTPHMEPNMAYAITNWLNAENIYPNGRRGKMKYSNRQIEIFKSILNAVKTNQLMVASTNAHIKRGLLTHLGFNGESLHNGLAGPHAYEVIDCRMKPHWENKDEPMPYTICWIKLRNPWGKTGRIYKDKSNGKVVNEDDHWHTQGKMVDESTDAPEFWMPLEDFTKRFNRLTIL